MKILLLKSNYDHSNPNTKVGKKIQYEDIKLKKQEYVITSLLLFCNM